MHLCLKSIGSLAASMLLFVGIQTSISFPLSDSIAVAQTFTEKKQKAEPLSNNQDLAAKKSLQKAVAIYKAIGGNFERKSLEKSKKIENYVAKNPIEQEQKAARLIEQGNEQFNNNQFSEARRFFEQALAVYQKNGDRFNESVVLSYIALTYVQENQVDKALNSFEQLLAIAQETDNPLSQALAFFGFGHIYSVQGEYDKALNFFKQSLVINRAIGNRIGEGMTLEQIGLVYIAQGNYDKALEYLEQSLIISRESGDRQKESEILATIKMVLSAKEANSLLMQGNQQFKNKKLTAALKSYEEALSICQNNSFRPCESQVLLGIGIINMVYGNSNKAIRNFEQALSISKEIKDRRVESISLFCFGGYYLSQGNFDKARKYFEKALSISQEIGDDELESQYLIAIKEIERQID